MNWRRIILFLIAITLLLVILFCVNTVTIQAGWGGWAVS